MLFTKALLSAAVFAVAAQAAEFTNSAFGSIKAGTVFNITYGSATGEVTLKLKNGPASAQNLVSTIASNLPAPSGSFAWSVPTTLTDGTYNLEIDDNSGPNYSLQFQITGGSGSSSQSSQASTASSTATVTSTSTSSGTSVVTTTSTASPSTSTPFSNSTTSTRASSTSSRTGSATSSSASATQTGGATVQLASPFALILTAFVAFAYLN